MTPAPPRGFARAEFEARRDRAQALMAEAGLAALLLTEEADIRWLTGFLTRFWESPTRPWYVILPASGDPAAVVPSIGARLMRETWLSDVRDWPSPAPGGDGAGLLAETLAELAPEGRIGLPSAPGTVFRAPLATLEALRTRFGARLGDDRGVMRRARLVKSAAEVEKCRHAGAIAGRAFARLREEAREGDALSAVFRRFQALCLEEGADWVAYLAGGAGPDGYGDVISPAGDAPLALGDVLMLDTGVVWDGAFCDFDRNFSVGPPSAIARAAHARLIEATEAGFAAARPGATAAELFRAMDAVLGGGSEGRLGHGLGMQLTEPPSLLPHDDTVLEAGMILTLEPGIETGPGRLMVHEENIVVTETGAEWLSPRAGAALPELGA